MATAALKKTIKSLVDQETSVRKLERVLALLTEVSSNISEPVIPCFAVGKIGIGVVGH